MMDGSYGESGGTVGAQAPVGIEHAGEDETYYYGTLYTRDMLTAALRGEGTCNSVDRVGHGTACASVAAGNGLATAYSVPAGTYAGVAPEADLMVCRAGDGAFDGDYIKAVEWIADTAASLGRPCVINLSLGGHASAHDGQSAEEQFLDRIAARPGVAICVSAGNEGRQSFHTSGRFGPRDSGYADVESDPVELFVSNTTELHAYYGMNDDWGFALVGLDNFLTDAQGEPGVVYVSCQSDRYSVSVSDNITGLDLSNWQAAITFRDASADREIVSFPVPPGRLSGLCLRHHRQRARRALRLLPTHVYRREFRARRRSDAHGLFAGQRRTA